MRKRCKKETSKPPPKDDQNHKFMVYAWWEDVNGVIYWKKLEHNQSIHTYLYQ